MRLVYKETGEAVQVGDLVTLRDGDQYKVERFDKPHKPSSSGKCILRNADGYSRELFVGVMGAEWIEREDRL